MRKSSKLTTIALQVPFVPPCNLTETHFNAMEIMVSVQSVICFNLGIQSSIQLTWLSQRKCR